jgi:hypothetical protein
MQCDNQDVHTSTCMTAWCHNPEVGGYCFAFKTEWCHNTEVGTNTVTCILKTKDYTGSQPRHGYSRMPVV